MAIDAVRPVDLQLTLLETALALNRLRRVGDGLSVGVDLDSFDNGEGTEDMADVTPPLLTEAAVPLDCLLQTVGKRSLLVPAELTQLGAVDGVAVVVEGPVVGILDPLAEVLGRLVWNAKLGQELAAESQVADLVVRANIVNLAHLSLVEDCVERIRSISGIQVAAGRGTITMQNNGLLAVQQA